GQFLLCLFETIWSSCFAIPSPDAESPASHHEFNKDNKLYKATLKAFAEFVAPLGERYAELLEKIEEDLKANEEAAKFEKYLKHLDNLIDGVKHLKADDSEETLHKIVELTHDLVALNHPNDDAKNRKLVAELFDKDSGKKFVEEFRKNMVEFFDGFDDACEEYVKDLSEEEKAEHKDFLKWFKELKETEDHDKKFVEFLDFFKFFDPVLLEKK
uniref:Uncharacterized protein n=1 Tax=Glossina brevipalpis TaxID=37001 RepID=A0A1A9W3X1_9MUSC